jgi:hypothetical protein
VSDRRAASKARLAIGQRCFKLIADEVGLAEFLKANNHLGRGDHTPEEISCAVSQWIAKLVAKHKQKLESDMSLQAPLRCAIVWLEDDLPEKD